jgi:nucleoside-diphosphate-sugar epimerase
LISGTSSGTSRSIRWFFEFDTTTLRFVYSSSSSIYGDAPDLPTLETTLPRPVSPYGVSKLAGEKVALCYGKLFDMTVVALRYFDGLTQSEIADQVGISQMHVSRLLARSLATLRA